MMDLESEGFESVQCLRHHDGLQILSLTCPHDTFVVRSIGLLHEDIVTKTLIQSWVRLGVIHGRIYHDYVVLVSGVNGINEILDEIGREPLRVKSEDASTIHVVNYKRSDMTRLEIVDMMFKLTVRPHCLKGNTSLRVVGNDSSDLVDILVAISALMEPQTPVRAHEG